MGSNYFTPENSWRHLFFVTGLTADEFYTDGGLKLNIEQLTYLELKKSGYERIVFYDKDNKLYCYDDDSFALLRVNGNNRKVGTVEVENSTTLVRQNRGLKRGRHAHAVSSNAGSHSSSSTNVSALDEVQTSGEKNWDRSLKTGILIKTGGNGPLHLGMRDTTFVKRQIDAYMHDALIKTAVVINDPTAFGEEFGQDPLHSLTAGYERMGTENENIIVFLYTDGNLANFYKVNQFASEDKDANIINIECPNASELKNMLMYLRCQCDLKIRMKDLDNLAISLRQAMSLSEHQIRIKEVFIRLKAFGTNKLLTPDLCYELVGVKKPDSAKKQLEQLIGMQSVKDVLESYDVGDRPSTANIKYLTASRLSPNLPMPEKKSEMIHFVITGNPGTGKTTVAKLLGQMFYEMGYLESGHLIKVTRKDLVAGYVGQTAIKTADCIQKALGGVLFIDEAYSLKSSENNDGDFGIEAINTLLEAMTDYEGKFIVVVAGYPKEMETFINSNSGLQSRFTEKIHIEDYTAEEMHEILQFHAKRNSVKFSDDLSEKLFNFCENWVNLADESWGNAREAENLIKHMIRSWKKDSKAKSVIEDGQTIGILEERHIPENLLDNLKPVEDMRAETLASLNAMIGLEKVKKTIEKLRRRIIAGDQTNPGHYLYTGNPGTGKTTVARYMGQILRNLELLKRGHLIEYTASKLISEYYHTYNGDFDKLANRALNGVLFIDEAHQLGNSEAGIEIIRAMVPYMENNRKNISIILAGYDDGISELLKVDDGLESRFEERIHFENYTGEELCKILIRNLEEEGITVNEGYRENATRALTRYVRIHGNEPTFGNARYIRTTFIPESKDAQTNRLIREYGEGFNRELKKIMTAEDIPEQLIKYTKTPLEKYESRSAMEEINNLIGFAEVKTQLKRLIKLRETAIREGREDLLESQNLHWVLRGNPGTGKTTVAKLIGKVYKELGLLSNGRVSVVKRQDLVAEYLGQTAPKTQKCIDRAMGGVLFIDEAYTLARDDGGSDPFGQEAIDTILEQMSARNGEFAVIAAGYPREMNAFLDSNPGFRSRFSRNFLLKDYTAEELTKIFESKCRNMRFYLGDGTRKTITRLFNGMMSSSVKVKEWANGREAENLEREMRTEWAENPVSQVDEKTGEKKSFYTVEHIPKSYRKFLPKGNDADQETSAMEEINNLIGFAEVKEELRDFMRLRETCIREGREDLMNNQNLHWVLRGNPGTGKTTVAKLIGKVYKELGLLSNGRVSVVKRQDLVAEYLGQTAPKTQKCIDRAMGGVLFVDEAYTLSESGLTSGDAYGKEAIDTILEQMSAHNGEFAVVVAGYPREMDRFLDANPGFRSRFASNFLLPDYSEEELTDIFELKCHAQKFYLGENTKVVIQNMFKNMIAAKIKGWGNGREAENLQREMLKMWAKKPVSLVDDVTGERRSYYTVDHIPTRYLKYMPSENSYEDIETSEKEQESKIISDPIPMNKLVVPKKEFHYEEAYLDQVDSVVFIRTSTEDGTSSGSGSIITSDGHILTCSHVISGKENIQVRLQDRKNADVRTTWEDADVVWEDTDLDVAILKIRDGKYDALPLRTLQTETFTGEAIYLWGYPFGGRLSDNLDELQPSLFQGYISSIQTKNGIERINTNMEAKRGCSGGPVFSKKDGCIVGILCGSQTVGDEGLIEEINYVLPVKYLFGKVFK